jgi:hypothetical protein
MTSVRRLADNLTADVALAHGCEPSDAGFVCRGREVVAPDARKPALVLP